MSASFDIVIVGGGMVGSMLAAALGHSNLSIAVIETAEPSPFSQDQDYDLRVSAVSLASQHMFEAVGAWQPMLDKRVCPYRNMRVWDGEGGGEVLFDSGDVYQPLLGNIVENRIIQLSLIEALKRHENVEWFCPEQISSFTVQTEFIDILLESGRQIRSQLIVGADGANSIVRSLSEIEVEKKPYGQHALVATVKTELPQQDITWQRFQPTGPQAMLPLQGHRASLVWYHSEEQVKRLQALADSDFVSEVEQTFPERLGKINGLIGRGSFALIKSHSKNYVKNRVVLVGDAAHTIHPLAGQGVNLGLMDAAVLADVILSSHNAGRDFAKFNLLRKYERARRGYNNTMIAAMDIFHHAFKEHGAPLRLLRSSALNIADKAGPLKHVVMKVAMGLVGDLPALARGKIQD